MCEITPWTVYWIMRLDSVKCGLEVVSAISTVAAIAFFVVFMVLIFDDDLLFEEHHKVTARKGLMHSLFVLIASVTLYALFPSTKEMCAIVTIPVVANSDIVTTQIPDATRKLLYLANQYLESQLEEAK